MQPMRDLLRRCGCFKKGRTTDLKSPSGIAVVRCSTLHMKRGFASDERPPSGARMQKGARSLWEHAPVRATRFELATFWSVARRSIQLSYARICHRSPIGDLRTRFGEADSNACASRQSSNDKSYYKKRGIKCQLSEFFWVLPAAERAEP